MPLEQALFCLCAVPIHTFFIILFGQKIYQAAKLPYTIREFKEKKIKPIKTNPYKF